MAFGLEINEARSIYLVIDDNLLLLVRKVLNLSESLLFVPGSESLKIIIYFAFSSFEWFAVH